jgi:hypothetical protein
MREKRSHHLVEAFLQNVEAAADLLTDNEAVKAIPVVGTAVKLCQGLDDIRARALAAKLQAFIAEPHLQSPAASEKIKRKLATNSEEFGSVGEVLFLVLERLIDLDKPQILAKVFVAYLDEAVSQSELKRLAQAVDLAFGEDLLAFLNAEAIQLQDETQPWMPLLEPSGLTASQVDRAPPAHARTRRRVTSLGNALWKAWRHVPKEA